MENFLDCGRGITGYSLLTQLEKITGRKIKLKKYTEKLQTRTFSEVKKTIKATRFSNRVQRKSIRFFSLLAHAEANVHRTTPGRVHLHEVAREENIFRVLAVFSLLQRLNIKKFTCTPINVGRGQVKTVHGLLSIPTPATRELLRGLPTFRKGKGELTTPTGACFARMLCKN